MIKYWKGGLLDSTDTIINDTINTLNLNYQTLQDIRKVWYYLSNENFADIKNATTEKDRNTILTLNLSQITKGNLLISTYKTEQFWNILMGYSWFYDYYKQNP